MQESKLYIGNLSYFVINEDLIELFSNYGKVKYANVIEEKGFGFIEMSSQAEAEKAKEALNNFKFKGRYLKIKGVRPPRKRQA